MSNDWLVRSERASQAKHALPQNVATPCFVVFEEDVRTNLLQTAEACGGIERLMPHVKTHRAAWVVRLFIDHGVTSFKCATPAEVEMILGAGAQHAVWAYPTTNRPNIRRVIEAAKQHPDARVVGMADSWESLAAWEEALGDAPDNVRLRIDLDPGLGRTGVAMTNEALLLSKKVYETGRFDGWHFYDGHNRGPKDVRAAAVERMSAQLESLLRDAEALNIRGDIIAGGSYSFNLWSPKLVRYVSPGSFTYPSAPHLTELADLGWRPSAYVLATVVSTRKGTATLDAGAKAVSPDRPLKERFQGLGAIVMMNEEHTVVESNDLSIGDQVLLLSGHTCTTCYLYDHALVRTLEGKWETRPQLGNSR
jgi:D-serine deaminase-like pyridoxal phosphate-dependent protein